MANQQRGLPRLQDLPSNYFFLDDSNTSLIKYTGSFTKSQNETCAGSTCTRLESASASLEFTFNGQDVFLFGKPGGIARVFLDNQLRDILDTNALANNGSALWAATSLPAGSHTVKLSGVDGDGLNLLVDFFSINGVVSTPTYTDSNHLSPEKLTPIIIGSLFGFFALVALIGISIALHIRRKRSGRIHKNGIQLLSIQGSDGSDGRRSESNIGFMSGLSRILSTRQRSNVEKGPQTSERYGFGERISGSTDSENPFLKSPGYAAKHFNDPTSPYSPPVSDSSVPLFARSLSQAQPQPQPRQQQYSYQNPAQFSFIPEPTTASSYASIASPPYQHPTEAPLQQQQLRMILVPSNQHQRHGSTSMPPLDNLELAQERAPLMERPPVYSTAYPQSQQQQGSSFVKGTYPDDKAVYQNVTLPPRGEGGDAIWSASTVSTFPTIAHNDTRDQTPQPSIGKARTSIPDAPYSPPPPSFKSLEPHAGPTPNNYPSLSTKGENSASKNRRSSSGRSLKGPRSRAGSSAQPTWPSTAEEKYRGNGDGEEGRGRMRSEEMNHVGTQGVGSPSVGNLRVEDEEPESPVDPGANVRSHWY